MLAIIFQHIICMKRLAHAIYFFVNIIAGLYNLDKNKIIFLKLLLISIALR